MPELRVIIPTWRFTLGAVLVALLLGTAVAAWYLLPRVDPEIAVGAMGAAATILAATVVVVGGRIFERERTIESEQRTKRAAMYEDFAARMLHVMRLDQPAGQRKDVPAAEMAKFIADFTASAMTWASGEVITHWSAWRALTADKDKPPSGIDLLIAMEDVIRAMRRDLGHKDKGLDDHQLLRLFVTDLDAALAAGA